MGYNRTITEMKKKIFKIFMLLLVGGIAMATFGGCKQDPTKGILKVYVRVGYSYAEEGVKVRLNSTDRIENVSSLGYAWFNDLTPGTYTATVYDSHNNSLYWSKSGTVSADGETVIYIDVPSGMTLRHY